MKICTNKPCWLNPHIKKFLLIMKVATLLIIVSVMHVSATTLAQKVTLNQKNITIAQLFREITRQTGYSIITADSKVNQNKRLNVEFKGADLDVVLKKVFESTPYSYRIESKNIVVEKPSPTLIEKLASSIFAIDARGKITDAEGMPLSGATVKLKKGGKSVQTNQAGEFLLKGIDDGETIEISFIGYKTIERAAREQMGTIVMELSTGELEAVNIVSTGYQTISKERSAGSFAKPNKEILADRSTSMNILQRIDGLVPGLTVNNSPQSENPFLIRGLSTINGGRNPLYVVDGVPVNDISSINPQDVADITVLRDATAASIWGARASNGVIVIVTKRGGQNQKLRIEFDGFLNMLGKPDLDYIPAVNSQQYIQTLREIFDPAAVLYSDLQNTGGATNNGNIGIQPAVQTLYDNFLGRITTAQMNTRLDSMAALNNRNQINDLFYRNAFLTNQTLSISNGGKIHSIYGSLSYTNNHSPTPGERNSSYKLNLRQDFRFNDIIQAFLITDLTNNVNDRKRYPSADYRFVPYQLFRDSNGNNLPVNWAGYLSNENLIDVQSRSRINMGYNPLNEVDYGHTNGSDWINRITGGVTIKPLPGLKFEGTYGYFKGNSKVTSFDSQDSYLVRSEAAAFTVAPTTASVPVYYLPVQGGRYSITNSDLRNWTVRNQLSYDLNWNNRHQLTLLAGQEAQSQLTITNGSNVRGYDENLQTFQNIDYATLQAGLTNPVVSNQLAGFSRSVFSQRPFSKTETEFRFTSYFANLGYTLDRKYTINGSWRIDKSNLFGLDKSAQNRPVWSVGGKWQMNNEHFLSTVSWLNNLALRATYGITGNSPAPGSAGSYNIFSPGSSAFFPNRTGLGLSSVANRKITWESTKTVNLGIDFGVLKDRISGSLDFYHKNTTDLLGEMPTNPFTGYESITGNYGDMVNKGVELSITSRNIAKEDFSWTSIVNMAYNHNKITQLNNPTAVTTGNDLYGNGYVTGYSAFSIFAYNYAGLDNAGDPQIRRANGDVVKAPNVALPEDMLYMGTYQPVWSGGISNIFRYKNFQLSANAVLNLGHVMRKDVNSFYGGFDNFTGMISPSGVVSQGLNAGLSGGQINPIFLQRWKKPGDEAFTDVPAYIANSSLALGSRDINYWLGANTNVLSASYIKLRDITLSYRFPKHLSSKIRSENITLRAQVSNIMLWKANGANIDPELHVASSGMRVPYLQGSGGVRTDASSSRFGQGTVTLGLHVNF